MFKKAERKKAKLKLALTGPSGAGKTKSALRLATGMGGKIAFIDTENGSASMYADEFDFEVMDMAPPFTTEKYIAAIEAAEKAGFETIVIDSLTHAWAGEGGLLEQKALLDSRPNSNHWTNWGPIDKKDNALKNAFLHSTCHIITTMRSKMEYSQTEANGKKKIEKVGLAPIQRDGLSYEFSIVFDIAMDHNAEASKDRTGLFDGLIFKITEETGEKLATWLNSGKELAAPEVKVEPTKPVETPKPMEAAKPKPETIAVKEPYVEFPEEPKATIPFTGAYRIQNGKNKGKALAHMTLDEIEKQVYAIKAYFDREGGHPYGTVKDDLEACVKYLNEQTKVEA